MSGSRARARPRLGQVSPAAVAIRPVQQAHGPADAVQPLAPAVGAGLAGGGDVLRCVEAELAQLTEKDRADLAGLLIESLDGGTLHVPKESPAEGAVVKVGALVGWLLAAGESPRDERIPVPEHAAWTQVASLVLNLSETVTRN